MQPPAIQIFTALEIEARFIRDALRRQNGGSESPPVCPIGIRAVRLPPIERGMQCIMLAGFAGAIEPSLKVGDIVLDCPLDWVAEFKGRRGSICCSSEIISTPQQKSQLFRQSGALAVDMESQIVRAKAAEAGIPFMSIRAISDSADQSLDPALVKLVDPLGRPKPSAVVKALLRRPMLIGDLLQLRAASNLAGKSLGEAVAQLLSQLNAKLPGLSPSPPHAHLSERQT